MFLIGYLFLGQIKAYKHQYIDTQFVLIMLPLYPVKSFFTIAPNKRIDIGLYKPSIIKSYISSYSLIMGIVLLTIAWATTQFWLMLAGILMIMTSGYFFSFSEHQQAMSKRREIYMIK